jgi:hypothetical protein
MEAGAHGFSGGFDFGARIEERRRTAGLSRKELAKRAGISLWALEEVEEGRKDASPYALSIGRAIGLPLVLDPTAATVPKPAVDRAALSARLWRFARAAAGRELVLGSIAILVLIRFFTEVVHVVPRAANFVDIPIFFTLGVAALTRPRIAGRARYMHVALPVLLFVGVCAVSSLANLNRVDPGPVLVFVYGFLGPLGVYAATYRIWPAGNAMALSRLLVWLGLIELTVVFTIDLRRFVARGHNADVISGTFGTDGYQLVFFLLLVLGLLAGIFTIEPKRAAARFAPVLFVLILGAVFLAQYRALLVTTGVTVLVIAVLLGRRARGVIAGVFIVASLGITLQYVSSHFPNLKFASTISTLTRSPGFYVSKRLGTARGIQQLYTDTPRFILTGSGPGTFSSRAWQTFALGGGWSGLNVQGPYVRWLTGGSVYHTDVSDRYVMARIQNSSAIQGSNALTNPWSDYLSLLAETGVFGLILILGVYLRAAGRALQMARESLRNTATGDALPALFIASAVAFTVLLQMGVLGDWLEVTRLSFITWAIFGVASKELAGREQARA